MPSFSIRRIMALMAYCAVGILALANPFVESAIWRAPVWLGPAAVCCLPFFGWFILFGPRRYWITFVQLVVFAGVGLLVGAATFESPLPGALFGLLAYGLLIWALSVTKESGKRKVILCFGAVLTVTVATAVGMTWRQHVARRAIRQTGGTYSWHPQLLTVMPSWTRFAANSLGPHLVPGGTYAGADVGVLSTLTNLNSLDLRGTRATASSVAELRKAPPKCRVQH